MREEMGEGEEMGERMRGGGGGGGGGGRGRLNSKVPCQPPGLGFKMRSIAPCQSERSKHLTEGGNRKFHDDIILTHTSCDQCLLTCQCHMLGWWKSRISAFQNS